MLRSYLLTTALVTTLSLPAMATSVPNNYTETRLVANKASYKAATVDEKLINAWGIAIRPAGKGGHFWVTAKNTSFEYVGDVSASPDKKLRRLTTDNLTHINLPVGGDDNMATSVTFSDSKENFIVTQKPVTGDVITAPAKFLFASDGGIISAWTERKKEDGSFDRPMESIPVIDMSKNGSQFFGLTMNKDYSRLYATDFGQTPGIKVFDGKFKLLPLTFDSPFDENKNGKVDPGEYTPFNIQALTTPRQKQHIFVTYAKTQPCPAEEVKKNTCKAGELFVGEEDTKKPGNGRVAEFTEEGKLVAIWNDDGHLSAPWGIVFAPENFGALHSSLLVANFGDGTIAAYDLETRNFIDTIRSNNGEPVKIDKIWGLLFGNGESLGDTHALYYSAGPNDEQDGLFGSLRPATK
jgi:uncharacterized protein (TIGR03118 family)